VNRSRKSLIVFALVLVCLGAASYASALELERGVRNPLLPYVNVRAGVDYFYIDPGTFMPKSDDIEIKSQPFYYFDAKLGWDFRFVGLGARLKSSFSSDSLKDDPLNKEDSVESAKESKTRERIFNMTGTVTPFVEGDTRRGIFAQGEFRLFQTKLTVDSSSVDYIDKTSTQPLSPDQDYYVNMFQRTYSAGFLITRPWYYFAVGYGYNKLYAPFWIAQDAAVEAVTAQTHSLFLSTAGKMGGLTMECEASYGIARFRKPNGETVAMEFAYRSDGKTAKANSLYRDNIINRYIYNFTDNLYLSGHLGYSGYIPIHSAMTFNLAIAALNQTYLWGMAITQDAIPALQAPANILFNYLVYKWSGNKVLYADILAGIEAGIRI